jgi:hypothetical protein
MICGRDMGVSGTLRTAPAAVGERVKGVIEGKKFDEKAYLRCSFAYTYLF